MAEITAELAGAIIARRAEVTPIAGRTTEIFNKRVEMIRESDSPLAVLACEEAPSQAYMDGVVIDRIGTPDKNGKVRISTEQRKRRARANEATTILAKIAKGEGIDVLATNTVVIRAVESLISQHPNFLAQYNALTGPQKLKFVENLLRESTTRSKVIELLGNRVKLEEETVDGDIAQKKEDVYRLESKKKQLEKEKTDLEVKKKKSEDELAEFESSYDHTTTPPTIKKGEYVQKLSDLESKIGPLTRQTVALASEIEMINSSIGEIRRARVEFVTGRVAKMTPEVIAILADYDSQIQGLKVELSNKKNAQNYNEQQLAKANQEKAAIEARRTTLESSITSINERLSTLAVEISENAPELIEAKASLRASVSRKEVNEEKFVNEIESILSEAIRDTINDDLKTSRDAEREFDVKSKADAESQLERTVTEAMTARYQAGDDINWGNFRIDYTNFLHNGPDSVIAHLLPRGTTLDSFRKDNPTLYQKITLDLTKKIARLRLQEPRQGGRLVQLLGPRPVGRTEILAIVNRFGESTFTDALKTNTEFRNLMEQAKKDKVLNVDGKVSEGIKKLPIGKILLILAALLGIGMFKGAAS